MAVDMDCSINELMGKEDIRKRIELARYVTDTIGMPTLTDIMDELKKPGRDPRKQFEQFKFTDGVER